MSKFRKMIMESRGSIRTLSKRPQRLELEVQCAEQLMAFGTSAARLLGQKTPSSPTGGILSIMNWVTDNSLVHPYFASSEWIKGYSNTVLIEIAQV